MARRYVDVSAYQGAIDWPVYRTWSDLVAMKATEGTSFIDPRYHANRAGAEGQGIESFFYHFARPDLNGPQAEAEWFFKVVGAIKPNELLMLDAERSTPQPEAPWSYAWLSHVEQLYGKTPTIYASESFIQEHLQGEPRLARFNLIFAKWTFDPNACPKAPAPWTSYIAIQWTDRATNIPGIQGLVDADVFVGEFTSMQQYSPQSSDFSAWFVSQDADHWLCKQTSCTMQYAIKTFVSQLSMDGQTLPIIGLPTTNEIYLPKINGKQVVVQIYERAGVGYDPDHAIDRQPGTGDFFLFHLTDANFLAHVPGLVLPAAPVDISTVEADIHAFADVVANAVATTSAKALTDLAKLKG